MKRLLTLAILFAAACFAQGPAHSVTLTWNWSQGTGGSGTGFQVQRSSTAGGPYSTIGSTSAISTLTYADVSATGNILAEGATYYYVVETVNNLAAPEIFSVPSTQAAATIPYTPPATPTGVTAQAK